MFRTPHARHHQPRHISFVRPWFILKGMEVSDVVRDESLLGKVASDLHVVPKDVLNKLKIFDYTYSVRRDRYHQLKTTLDRFTVSQSESDEEDIQQERPYINCVRAALIAKKLPETPQDFYELSEALRTNSPFCGALCWAEPKKRNMVVEFLRNEALNAGYKVPGVLEKGSMTQLKSGY